MNKKILTIVLVGLFLATAIFGTAKIVSAQQGAQNQQIPAQVLPEPITYRIQMNNGYGLGGGENTCNGDCLRTRDQIRLRLQDGTGENCPNPEGCSGQGPQENGVGLQFGQGGQAGWSSGQSAGACINGDCDMDQDRLRDGSCGDGGVPPQDGTGSQFRHGKN